MSEPFKLRIESEADLAGLDAYLKGLAQADVAQVKADGSLQQLGAEAKKTEMTFGALERELQQARLALSMMTPSDARLPDLQRHIAGVTMELGKAGAGMRGFRGDVGQAALMLAQFGDDAQYGIRGIMNNVPGLVMAFGGGAGLAGVLSLGLLAGNQLYERLTDSSGAAGGADSVKGAVESLKAALNAASEEAIKVYEADLDAYVQSVKDAATAWKEQADEAAKARGEMEELARLELSIATRKLEIEKQTKMAGAGSEAERQAIAADYDARKATLTDQGRVDASQRAVDAAKALEQMLQGKALQAGLGVRQSQDAAASNEQASGQFGATMGQLSDQARQVREFDKAQDDRRRAVERLAALNKPGATMESTGSYEGEMEELEVEVERLHGVLDAQGAGIARAREALKTGKGLTFNKAQAEAEADVGAQDDPRRQQAGVSMLKALEDAAVQQKQLEEERVKIAEALKTQEAEMEKIRKAQVEAAKQTTLRTKQLEDARLAAKETEAKTEAKAAATKAKDDEAAAKKLREELAMRAENDAKEWEMKGDKDKALKARQRAAEFRLSPDSSPEEKRRVQLEADSAEKELARQKREEAARKKTRPDSVDASGVAGRLDNLAANMMGGPQPRGLADRRPGAGKADAAAQQAAQELQRATAALKDGATGGEIDAVLAAVRELTPAILQRFSGSDTKLKQLEQELRTLKAQVANTRN